MALSLRAEELRQLLADIRDAIEPYVDDGEGPSISAAARAALQTLVENNAIEVDDD